MSEADFRRRVDRALRAGARALAIVTDEEARALEILEEIAEDLGWPLHTWSSGRGVDHGTEEDLRRLLRRLVDRREDEIWVLLDPRGALADPACARLTRDLAQRSLGPALVIATPERDGVPDVPELNAIELPLPDARELAQQVAWIGRRFPAAGHQDAAEALAGGAAEIARAAVGLTRQGLDQALAEGIVEHGFQPAALAAFVAAFKPRALDRHGLLEHVAPVPIGELGGHAQLKRWLERRRAALDPAAAPAGIPAPRGVLLVGVPGCGKSLAARASADLLALPLVRLDAGRLFGGTVGESERNLRRSLAVLDRMAPIVLWLDEIDKGLAGADASASDAGTTARVVASLLTWLQDREQPVFVVATANEIRRLPPELSRKGRLDEIFFVDLPDADEREAIADVHLRRRPGRERGQAPPLAGDFSGFAAVVRAAEGFSGAELEAAIVEARLDAFAQRRPVSASDLARALERSVPLSRSHAEGVAELRAWAATRARPAGGSLPG
jgi:hypothetical protein